MFPDPAALDRIRTLSRRAGLACAVVAVWAALWFGFLLATGGEVLGLDDSSGVLRLVGGIGLGIAVLVGVVAFVLLRRARRLAGHSQPVFQVGPEGVDSAGQDSVPLEQITHVVTGHPDRPLHWAPTLGGTAGNEIGHRIVGTPDQLLLVEVHRRSGAPLRVNLALHVPEHERAHLLTDLHAVLEQHGVPVTTGDGPSPTP